MNPESPSQTDAWQAVLTAYSLVYGFLSKVFYEPPQAGFVCTLFTERLFADWPLASEDPEMQQGLKRLLALGADWNADRLAELDEDYRQLFLGPGALGAYPWESVYLSEEHVLFETQTLEVRAAYQRFGLQAPRKGKEPDDHLGLELAFMVHLCVLGLNALAEDNTDQLQVILQAQRDFLAHHLLRWAPTCFRLVLRNARTDYYRGSAALGLGVLSEAARLFDLQVESVPLE